MINNTKRPLFVIIIPLILLLTLVNSHAASRGDDLLQEIDGIMNASSYESYFQIINHTPNGSENRITAYSAKQRDGKAVVLIVAPKKLQGRAVLRLGDDVWTHIPGELHLRKSTLRHSFVGGVFNNIDFLTTSYAIDHKTAIISENKKRYVLKLIPKSDSIPYKFIEMYVPKKDLRPTKLIQFADHELIIKTIYFDYSKKAADGKTVLISMNTVAEDNRKYSSTIKTGDIRKRIFPDMTFTKDILPKVGSILK
ncbi:MAG: outer membrane lipoprotein-sorting protein [Magnetococcales bacterium]|nr:outer membrane lipoprotein-sorting protein [Magnetococcales bacterium]